MLLSLLLACQDYTINEKLQGEPIIAPDFIDFGHLRSGQETGLRQIIFSNGGDAPLNVDYIEIVGERFDVNTSSFTVEPLAWHALDLTYIPETFEFNEGYLDVYLEGQEDPVSSVWFQGWGDAPVLTVDPPSVDYGALSEDCETLQEISFTNDGNLDLVITDIQQLASLPQQITANYGSLPGFPWIIIPQARISFWTEFSAVGLSLHSLNLKVASNDPHEPVKDVFVEGETMISTTMIETFVQGSSIFVDIIWVIDNSGSMSNLQYQLASNFSNFMTLFMSHSPNFQMAFITTDDPSFVNSIYFTQNDTNLINDASYLISNIGTSGSANEKGLQMLLNSMAVNSPWLRPGANLVAIFLSDERDWSDYSPTYYATQFDARYAPGTFLPFAIIGDVPGGCTSAQAGWGYWEIVDHYNTSWWSICDIDWGTQMQDIAQAVIDSSSYILDHPSPKEETISVYINGQEVREGWHYYPSSNSIGFDQDKAPEAGDTVEISYEIWECE
jgi:hypothetical protein